MTIQAEGTTSKIVWPAVRGFMTGTIAVTSVLPVAHVDASCGPTDIPEVAVMEISRDKGRALGVQLLEQWVDQTAFQSSPTIILGSQCLSEAKRLRGDKLVIDLLELLDRHPYHAVLGLSELVSPLPFGEELAGNVYGQVEAWKEWAGAEEQRSTSTTAE
jgi:hypothetical protein